MGKESRSAQGSACWNVAFICLGNERIVSLMALGCAWGLVLEEKVSISEIRMTRVL
jgi:hypothetical protein